MLGARKDACGSHLFAEVRLETDFGPRRRYWRGARKLRYGVPRLRLVPGRPRFRPGAFSAPACVCFPKAGGSTTTAAAPGSQQATRYRKVGTKENHISLRFDRTPGVSIPPPAAGLSTTILPVATVRPHEQRAVCFFMHAPDRARTSPVNGLDSPLSQNYAR